MDFPGKRFFRRVLGPRPFDRHTGYEHAEILQRNIPGEKRFPDLSYISSLHNLPCCVFMKHARNKSLIGDAFAQGIDLDFL